MRAPKHPGRSVAQRRALDAIGCGNYSPMMAKATRDALLRAGLVERLPDLIIGGSRISVNVEQFDMPIPVHMTWCAAVAHGVTDEEIEL